MHDESAWGKKGEGRRGARGERGFRVTRFSFYPSVGSVAFASCGHLDGW